MLQEPLQAQSYTPGVSRPQTEILCRAKDSIPMNNICLCVALIRGTLGVSPESLGIQKEFLSPPYALFRWWEPSSILKFLRGISYRLLELGK